jgi:HAD superfamily hydrolase (TIGR01450 family)
LPYITFAEAWREYRRAEARLPAKPPPVRPQRIDEVAAIAERFDLFVLDAWGVLNIGNEPIASAREAVTRLRRMGKRLVVLSNDATREPQQSAARHRARGFDIRDGEVIAGVSLLPETLARLAPPPPVGLIAETPAPYPALTAGMTLLGDDPGPYDDVSAFVFLASDQWSEARHALLQASLARRERPLIVGNPDIVSPEPGAMAAEPGYYAHRIADATGIAPLFCGKPEPAIYARVAALHPEIPPQRVLCIGDTLHTDILGGRAAGHAALLVEDGFCRGQDAAALAADCDIWPDFIAPRL